MSEEASFKWPKVPQNPIFRYFPTPKLNTERYRSGHNGTDSKSVVPHGTVGSNPTRSARLSLDAIRVRTLFFFRTKTLAPKAASKPFAPFTSEQAMYRLLRFFIKARAHSRRCLPSCGFRLSPVTLRTPWIADRCANHFLPLSAAGGGRKCCPFSQKVTLGSPVRL